MNELTECFLYLLINSYILIVYEYFNLTQIMKNILLNIFKEATINK